MPKSNRKLRVIIAGGGTGGHLFPGMAIAEELMERRDCEIRFVGTKRGIEKKILPEHGFKLYTLPVSGLYKTGLKQRILTLLKLPLAFLKSLWILLWFRPRLAIGVGGYASGPFMALAMLLGKKTVVQEQNAHPGITNRILGKHAPLSFIPFDKTRHLYKNPVVVGNPVRKSVRRAASGNYKRDENKTIVAVLGGSQGARVLNQTMIDALPLLSSIADKISVIHQTGESDYQRTASEYAKFPEIRASITPFVTEMDELYRKSRLLVCRAGSIINEIIAVGRASILIPIARASGDHQKENAKVMEAAKAAVMIEEKDLSPEKLFDVLNRLVDSPAEISEMETGAKSLYLGNAAAMIADKILEFYKL